MKVVVTGASGFLAGYVLRALALREGVELAAVSRTCIPQATLVPDYSHSPAGDVLIHLAENCDRAEVEEAGEAYEEGVNATLTALLAKGYSRVVYASSSVLYDGADLSMRSPEAAIRIVDAYTRIKRNSELAVLNSSGGVVGRLSNVYGPGMSEKNVLSTILRQLGNRDALEVMDTEPVRDFLWVEDAAEALVALALNDSRPAEYGSLFNLGSGVGTSIGNLARLALEVVGQSDRIVKARFPSPGPSSLVLDCSKTAAACGWEPRTSLRQGLASLLNKVKEKK
ncbi:MAG: NAD(P)-dependent oxidoreductase [Propionivibrio sp.]|uniref:NAD-dependent epimerase/dehydratase family protein n=1 Tax=Propionivibrio sp. TaxID=2212460 RepID=UPI0025F9E6A9|nr:NAD(P)-dependent oxidoreductase [Propionivibrio sp.]MBK7354716.1 NAD(P)-dependent oxidoreductase [Propionivibrio sp.]MBK8402087.1 NAD(P)-dependent oxidoreductase [Propionivibrio sp.]